MPSVREFVLPDLGEGLTEATIVSWLVEVGDQVEVDQPIVEVETAKSAVELPCPFAGAVSARHGAPGDVLRVGRPLVTIRVDEPGEPDRDAHLQEPAGSGASGNVLVGYGTAPGGPVPVVSPRVRRLAMSNGVDLRALHGPDSVLVTRADVLGAIGHQDAPAAALRVPLRGREKVAAEKFTRARREIPDVTCWLDADATALLRAKRTLADYDPPIGLPALLARICVDGLARHPRLNATVDTRRWEIVQQPDVHLGVATQSDRGLVVPVVRAANRLTTAGLAAELARVTETARQGGLTPGELTGSTFTLNNYGVLGVDGATPILNHPEAAMLGVGRITDRVWAHRGRPAVRKVVHLSLTFDHRVCDGAEAAGFLRFVADRVERPLRLLHDR